MKPQIGSAAWKQYLHFDTHVMQVLLQRGWQIIAGLVTLFVVPWALSSTEQGYYFTFASLLALQAFFELGLNYVVMQIAGHEAAKLVIGENGQIDGDPDSASRLMMLLSLCRCWYRIASPAFAVVILIVGLFFFQHNQTLPLESWVGAWLLLVVFTAVNLYLSPRLAILEGIGRVGEVARLRLYQSATGMLLMWIGFALGFGLWAVPVVTGVAALSTSIWLKYYCNLSVPVCAQGHSQAGISWQRDIFPMQSRMAMSWFFGWIIWNSFTPMLFMHQGAIEAGRIGLALSMFMSITTLGMSWVNAAVPNFLKYIALGERELLNHLFKKIFLTNACFVLVVSLTLLGCVAALKIGGFEFIERVASLPVLACLALVTVANSFISAAAVYMRAHKEEPMLWPSVVTGVLTGLVAWFGSKYGALPMTAAYAVITLCVTLPWTIILFRQYYRRSSE